MSEHSMFLETVYVEESEYGEQDQNEALEVIEADDALMLNGADELQATETEESENSTLAEDLNEENQSSFNSVPCSGRRGPLSTKPCPFICDVCGRELTTNGGLKVHRRIHTGETPFVCEVCQRQFSRQWSLINHMKTHTNERQYVCEQCGKSFKQSGHLTTHVRIHTGEKPFVCLTCDKRFNEGGKLDRHMRTHTGDRPYSCKFCNKRIAQYAGLLRHMRTHTGERPFQCPICSRRFTQSGDVQRHIRTHRESKVSDGTLHYSELQADGQAQAQVFKLLVDDVLKFENEGQNAVSEVYFV